MNGGLYLQHIVMCLKREKVTNHWMKTDNNLGNRKSVKINTDNSMRVGRELKKETHEEQTHSKNI